MSRFLIKVIEKTKSRRLIRELNRETAKGLEYNNLMSEPYLKFVGVKRSFYHLYQVAMAENKNTPVEILSDLSWSPSEWVRGIIAINLNTNQETLIKLSKDKDIWVREKVAKNPNTPLHTLEYLSKDRFKSVSSEAAIALHKRRMLY